MRGAAVLSICTRNLSPEVRTTRDATREPNHRRREHGVMKMGNAIRAADVQQLGQTTGGARLFSEVEIRDELTAIVLPYTPRQLAKVSGATPEGARHWTDGSRCPNLANTFNIARSIPAVGEWIVQKIGFRARETSAQSWDAWLRGLYAIAAGEGPDAMKARWAIASMNGAPSEQPEPRDTNTIDIFAWRKRA